MVNGYWEKEVSLYPNPIPVNHSYRLFRLFDHHCKVETRHRGVQFSKMSPHTGGPSLMTDEEHTARTEARCSVRHWISWRCRRAGEQGLRSSALSAPHFPAPTSGAVPRPRRLRTAERRRRRRPRGAVARRIDAAAGDGARGGRRGNLSPVCLPFSAVPRGEPARAIDWVHIAISPPAATGPDKLPAAAVAPKDVNSVRK